MAVSGAPTSRGRIFTKFVVCIVGGYKNDWVYFLSWDNAFGDVYGLFCVWGGSVGPAVNWRENGRVGWP